MCVQREENYSADMGRALRGPGAPKVACDCERFILGYKNTASLFALMCLYPFTVCTARSSQSSSQPARQTDTQTDKPHLEGCPPFPSVLPAPCLCHPTQRGEVVRLEWLARQASCVTTVCIWEGGREGSTGLITDPTTHWASQTATSQPVRETLQDLYCDNLRIYTCVLPSVTNRPISCSVAHVLGRT